MILYELSYPRVFGTTRPNNSGLGQNTSILSWPQPRNCGNHLGPISRGERDVRSHNVARGLRSATRTSTPDAGKSALTSFRGEPVSSTAPSREGFRMTRYQFFHNSYESLRLFLLILIATNPRQRGCNDNCKMSVRRIDKNVVTNKNRSVLSSAYLILYFANL